MRDLIVLGTIFGALPFVLFHPHIGVLLWAWISYMNPHRLTWEAYDYPVAAIVGGVTLVSLVWSWMTAREPKRIPWNGVTITLVLFIFWMNVTTLFALLPHDAFGEWSRTMKIQLMTLVTLLLFQSRERINWLVAIIALSIGFFGVKGGLFALMSGGTYKVYGPPESFIADNNSLALALVMVMPLMRYLQIIAERAWIKAGIAVAMFFTILSIVASYSRGAFLAASAMLLFMFFKSRRKFAAFSIVLVAAVLVLSFAPEKWYQRIETIGSYQQDASAEGRINAWWFAFNLAKHRPIVGGGFKAFDRTLFERYAPNPQDFHDSHSIYFEVLGEQGFVGLFLFILLGALAYRSGARAVAQARDHPELRWAADLATMMQVSLIGYFVGGTFLGLAYYDLYYHLVIILVLTRILVERQLQSEGTVPISEPTAVPAPQR